MTKPKDGGPAFPPHDKMRHSEKWEVTYEDGSIVYASANPGVGPSGEGVIVSTRFVDLLPCEGMSLRDWFAGTLPGPSLEELATAAGMIFSAGQIWEPSDGKIPRYPSFDRWWIHLSSDERRRHIACARYAQADAMLAEREQGGPK